MPKNSCTLLSITKIKISIVTMKKVLRFFKKLNLELPHDLAIPLWVYSMEITSIFQRDICAPMFNA